MASEGIVVETTIEDAAVQAMLSHAIARSIDLEPAFVLIGKRLAASTLSWRRSRLRRTARRGRRYPILL